jgi:hypothetical protein
MPPKKLVVKPLARMLPCCGVDRAPPLCCLLTRRAAEYTAGFVAAQLAAAACLELSFQSHWRAMHSCCVCLLVIPELPGRVNLRAFLPAVAVSRSRTRSSLHRPALPP